MSGHLCPLVFGGLTLENNLLQAPLAGYSSAPFRLLTWRLGRPGLLATEMISANALAMHAPRQERYLARLSEEGPVAYQIWGCDPEKIALATRMVTDCGADVVDLNCGCPVRKVRAAGAGVKLMEDPILVGRLIAAMRKSTDLPVTIKIRVGPSSKNYNGPEVARAAEAEGADLLTVHGRHGRESYSTPCRYDQIAQVVEAVSIPVIGNGDVVDGASARKMFETGCNGLMVARACMGKPWFFSQLKAALTGSPVTQPPLEEIGSVLMEHARLLVDLVGEATAIRQCRKLGSFYSRGMRGAKEFRNQLNFCHTTDDLEDLIGRYFVPNVVQDKSPRG